MDATVRRSRMGAAQFAILAMALVLFLVNAGAAGAASVNQAESRPVILEARNWYVVALVIPDPGIARRITYTRGTSPHDQAIQGNVWSTDFDHAAGRVVLVISKESRPAYLVIRDEMNGFDSPPLWEGFVGMDAGRRRAVRP